MTVEITVSDPAGPRAAVPYPPFESCAPVVGYRLVRLAGSVERGPAVRLEVSCGADLLRATGTDRFDVTVTTRAHETGNGYVVLGVGHGQPERPAPPDLQIVLDPVTHAPVVDALAGTGRLLVVASAGPGQPASGWVVLVDPQRLRACAAAALAHPRRVRFALPGAGR